jgi:hypothetical protein
MLYMRLRARVRTVQPGFKTYSAQPLCGHRTSMLWRRRSALCTESTIIVADFFLPFSSAPVRKVRHSSAIATACERRMVTIGTYG